MKRNRGGVYRQQAKDIADQYVLYLVTHPGKPSVGWTLVRQGWHPMVVYRKLEAVNRKLRAVLGFGLEYGTSLMTPWLERRT